MTSAARDMDASADASFDDSASTVESVNSQDSTDHSTEGESDKVSDGAGGGLIIKGGPFSNNRRPSGQKFQRRSSGWSGAKQKPARGRYYEKPRPQGAPPFQHQTPNFGSIGALPMKSEGYKNSFYQSMADETAHIGLY